MKVLKAVRELELSDVVLGQYEGDPDSEDAEGRLGYLDDKTVRIRIARMRRAGLATWMTRR